MPTTVGRTSAPTFLNDWVKQYGEAERIRVYGEPELPEPEPEQEPEPRTPRRPEHAMFAIANAMGVAVDSDDILVLDFTTEPAYNGSGASWTSYADMDATVEPDAPPDPAPDSPDSSRAYRVREGDWREAHNLPRRKRTVPPSRQPAARRQRHLRKLVELGKYPNVEAADRATQRRQSYGRPKGKAR